ncbi:MAG: CBS domain-containing protein, partial [archaeon]
EKLVVVDGKRPTGVISQRDISLASLGLYPSKVILIRKAGDKIHHHEKIMPAIVADVMKTNVETITKDEDCAEAAKKMLDKRIGSLIVVNSNGYLQGIITKTDLVRWMAENCK